MMQWIQTYSKELVSLIVPFIAWVLNNKLKGKVRLQLATPHSFTFLVQEPLRGPDGNEIRPTQTVHTQSVTVRNAGREPATRLEMVFNWEPMCANVWPPRHFEKHIEPDGRYVLIFDSLSPRETVGCEILSVNRELPFVVTVRCDQCVAQPITMYPQPVVSDKMRIVAFVLMMLGLAAAVYLSILVAQFLILATPYGH
ncbi:hypothetical protein P3T23_004539 [Paraburkholderia sp. GAS448]|uniref:hypothetical protein n=1 Tax=Paraburkholderia sp. GAS448 TaxID=3035136 RepID=UPI003D22555A